MSMFVAKSAAVIAFTLVYVFTAEMFPTTIRWVTVRGFHWGSPLAVKQPRI